MWYVRTRRSPGSPSQTIAALFRRGESTWRSRQFCETLIWPPTNHLAKGGLHSRTFDHFLIQTSSFARSDQYRSGSASASRRTLRSRTHASLRNDFGGGYSSFSFRRLSIVALETTILSPKTSPHRTLSLLGSANDLSAYHATLRGLVAASAGGESRSRFTLS